jgi:two-component system sensor histidine kinase YesM
MTTQLKDTMEERVAAERKINETRIAMMQSQLNPHFLYNTLDTIKWVAKANQVPEVATLSSSLAGILRMSISTRQFCTLETELKLVERYCEIQKIRFDDFFDLIINVPEELKDAVVPKLILQPLVENAIIHGLEDRDDGRLYISAESTEGSLEQGASQLLKIYIEDNGKGISDEMIEILEADDPSRLEGHLGLNNVNTIIKLYYGKDYGITANRLEVGGTIMTMILPLSKKEPEND